MGRETSRGTGVLIGDDGENPSDLRRLNMAKTLLSSIDMSISRSKRNEQMCATIASIFVADT